MELNEAEPLKIQCKAFIEAMSGKGLPLTDGAEGLRVLEVLAAASESMRSGGGAQALGGAQTYYVHPTALVDSGVEIGDGCKIWHFSHVLSGSEIGPGSSLGQNVVVGPKVKIGRGVKIQNNVSVYEGVTLEDEVFCGPSMVFTNVFNPRSEIVRKDEYRPTLVRRGATIGANATVVCGHTLGALELHRGRRGGHGRRTGLCPDVRQSGPPPRLDVPLRSEAPGRAGPGLFRLWPGLY